MHPKIISRGSAWHQSRLCAEAAEERRQKDAPLEKLALRERRRNLRIWQARGLSLTSAMPRARADLSLPRSPATLAGTRRIGKPGRIEPLLLTLLSAGPATLVTLAEGIPSFTKEGIKKALRKLRSAGLVASTPDFKTPGHHRSFIWSLTGSRA